MIRRWLRWPRRCSATFCGLRCQKGWLCNGLHEVRLTRWSSAVWEDDHA